MVNLEIVKVRQFVSLTIDSVKKKKHYFFITKKEKEEKLTL